MSDFKFQIGQTLRHAANIDGCDPWEGRKTLRLFVLDRVSQECSGGTQRAYVCRALLDGNPGLQNMQLAEIELAEVPAEPSDEANHNALRAMVEHYVCQQDFDTAAAMRTAADVVKKRLEKTGPAV